MAATTLNLQRQRASKLALVCVVLMVVCLEVTSAAAFPSLFTQSLFKRQQPQQQQQQQFPQPLKPQQDQAHVPSGLVKGDSSQQLQFGATQLLPGELMRISSMQQRPAQQPQQIGAHQLHQALMSSAASHPQHQRHFALYTDNEHEASPFSPGQGQASGAYYKRNSGQPMAASAAMLHQQQPLIGQEGGASFDLGDHTNYFADIQAASLRSNGNNQLAQAGSGPSVNQLHLEPTHTSEIVDKIEQHIGQQIEHNLKHDQADQKHQQQQTAAASGYQQAGEKETAQSEEQEETAAGHGGGGGSGSEVSSVDESGEEKIEKRHEEPHKHEHAESHKHQHEEHPPEAFEVHHKKGGKSFQYFHQGHHHHA